MEKLQKKTTIRSNADMGKILRSKCRKLSGWWKNRADHRKRLVKSLSVPMRKIRVYTHPTAQLWLKK